MTAKLIHYSQPPVESNRKGLTEWIAYCARVSNPSNQETAGKEADERLIKYLIRNHHWSPFEMVSLCMEIETTRDIIRQIIRHRSFSFQEFSQRYAEVKGGAVMREARLQDYANRQNCIEIGGEGGEDGDGDGDGDGKSTIVNEWLKVQQHVDEVSSQAYRWALENGIAKEQARCVLPEGMTPSRLYMNGTLRSWIHYIELRSGNGTQKEHREVALACARAMEEVFPMIGMFVSLGG